MTKSLDELRTEVGRREAEKWRANAIEALEEAGARLGWDVEPVIQSATPVERVSDGFQFSFESDLASIFEYGTTPHTITPNSGDVLAFEVDGEQVFAKEVHHPGQPALLYVQTGKNELTVQR